MPLDDPDKTKKAEGDCVIPPPVPPEVAGRYSVTRDPHAEQDIADYVEGQSRGREHVTHVEKVKTEHVLGEKYDIWDVATDKGRWWVITNPTNLYAQANFPSLDYTLSFHIGLMRRVLHNQRSRMDADDSTPFDEVARRQDQAQTLLDKAIEAEEFQAVGMQLRECLLALVAAMQRRVDLPADVSPPRAADFNAWSDVLMNALAPGETNQELRHHLKGASKHAWQLVNWLTHARAANRTASAIAFEACEMVISSFIRILVRNKTDNTDNCPRCGSRNVRPHFDISIEPDGAYFSSCGACGWDSHPGTDETASDEG